MSTALPPPPDPAVVAAAEAAFKKFATEAWTLFAVGTFITFLRLYARKRAVGIKGLGFDDILAFVAVLFYAAETAMAYSVGHFANGLANNSMTEAERAALLPDSPEYQMRVMGSKIQIAGWTTYATMLWCLKGSMLLFFIRLTDGLAYHYRIRIFIGFGVLISSYIVGTLNLYLQCRPFHKNWQINPDPGTVCQPAISRQILWIYLACNAISDLYLMSIPVPMLWGTRLRPAKKIGLIVLFSGGLFVIACAILRTVFVITDPVNGAQSAGSWAVRETFVAMVTTNLPVLCPLLKIWFAPIFGTIISSIRSKSDKTMPNLRTWGAGTKSQRGPRTANPIPDVTLNESEEYIVNGVRMDESKDWKSSSTNNSIGSSSKDIRKEVAIDITHEQRPKEEGTYPHMSADEEARRIRGSFPLTMEK